MDNEMLQAIGKMLDEKLDAQRTEMSAMMDEKLEQQKKEILAEVAAVEKRTTEQIAASKNEIMIYVESHVDKAINTLSDGHKMLSEKIGRIDVRNELDEIKGSLAVIESAVTRNTSSIIELQQAQG